MVALIVETKFSGHHLFYVALLARASQTAGERVILALSDVARSSEEFNLHIAPLGTGVEIVEASESVDWDVIVRLQESLRPRVTVVPDGDALLTGRVRAPRNGLRVTRVLIMRPVAQSFRIPLLSPIKTALKRLQIWRNSRRSNARAILLRSSAEARKVGRNIAIDPVIFSPNEVARARVRARLATDGDRIKWVGVFGAITARKNVPLVAEAIAFAAISDRRLGLVIAGSVAPHDRPRVQAALDSLKSLGVPAVLDDRRLADEDLDAYVEVSDCIALAHSNEGPSGLFGKALAAGTPVVAAGARSLKHDISLWPGCGEWVPMRSDTLAAALERATRMRAEPTTIATPEQFTTALLATDRYE